jgi:acyl-CoA thioester hydrolase
MLRAVGHSYKELEASGFLLVVRRMEIEYVHPAEFDDELTLVTTVLKARGARIEHDYQMIRPRDQQLIVTAQSEIACIDRLGEVRRLPSFLQSPRRHLEADEDA